jgi:hypothetical protein
MENKGIGVQFLVEARHILFSTTSELDLRTLSLLSNQRVGGDLRNCKYSKPSIIRLQLIGMSNNPDRNMKNVVHS